jgi:hypothetical protein
MNDPWNPSWDEIRAWASSSDPAPCQDWELACAWKEEYFADYVRPDVPVGNSVTAKEPAPRAFLARGEGTVELDTRWPAFEPYETLSDWRRQRTSARDR